MKKDHKHWSLITAQEPLIEGDLEIISIGCKICMILSKLKNYNSNRNIFANEAFGKFYVKQISIIEICRDGVLEQHHFQIPSKCHYLPIDIKKEIIFEAKRDSTNEKLVEFERKSHLVSREMKHQVHISKYTYLKKITEHWKLYSWLSYALIIIINITNLITVDDRSKLMPEHFDHLSDSTTVQAILIMGIFQFLLAILGFTTYLIEYLPMVAYEKQYM